jgi:hypothetical protein
MELSYNSRKYIEYRFEGFWDSSNPPHFMHNYKIPSSVLYQSLQFFIHSSKRFQKFGFELLLNLNRSIWFYCKCVVKWRWSRGFHGKLWTHTPKLTTAHTYDNVFLRWHFNVFSLRKGWFWFESRLHLQSFAFLSMSNSVTALA